MQLPNWQNNGEADHDEAMSKAKPGLWFYCFWKVALTRATLTLSFPGLAKPSTRRSDGTVFVPTVVAVASQSLSALQTAILQLARDCNTRALCDPASVLGTVAVAVWVAVRVAVGITVGVDAPCSAGVQPTRSFHAKAVLV